MRELRSDIVIERRKPFRLQARDVLVQRIDEDGERQARARAPMPTPERTRCPRGLGASGELREQPRLADPRFTRQVEGARMASVELVQEPLERTEFVGPPDEEIRRRFASSDAQGCFAPVPAVTRDRRAWPTWLR